MGSLRALERRKEITFFILRLRGDFDWPFFEDMSRILTVLEFYRCFGFVDKILGNMLLLKYVDEKNQCFAR